MLGLHDEYAAQWRLTRLEATSIISWTIIALLSIYYLPVILSLVVMTYHAQYIYNNVFDYYNTKEALYMQYAQDLELDNQRLQTEIDSMIQVVMTMRQRLETVESKLSERPQNEV